MFFRFQNLMYIILFSSLVGFGISVNGYERNEVKTEVSRIPIDSGTKEKLILVLKHNEKLHNAFFKYKAKKVESLSAEMFNLIEQIENEEISKILNPANKKLKLIKKENKRKSNDENYHLLTKALAGLVRKYDIGSSYNIYYCPMLRMKWVQNSTTMPLVHNPFAPEMPHCGAKRSEF